VTRQVGDPVEIPGYALLERIGGSDGADVWLAQQRALGRRVALKVLRGETSDAETLARFEFETRTAAELVHPHVVPLIDSGATADGRRYYAMPHLAGGALSERIPLAPAEVRRIGVALLDALWYAHGRNVVHRDIKPSNILFDENGRALLADFGIATSIYGARGLTRPGRALGAARYVSPEQARGEKVDPRADLYSLAVVLFEALTGRPPYEAADDLALAAQHADAPVPRLPERYGRWQPFFDRALAKAPGERFVSARAMGHALERIDVAEPAAVAAASSTSATAEADAPLALDALPAIRAEAPSYVEAQRARPQERSQRRFAGFALLGAAALAAVLVYALARKRTETFEPLVVDPTAQTAAEGSEAATAPSAEPTAPMAPSPGRVAAAAGMTPAPAAAARQPEVPRGAARTPTPARPNGGDRATAARAPAAQDDERVTAHGEDEDEGSRDDVDDDARYDERVSDERDMLEPDRDADWHDDPALDPSRWAPPIGRLGLDGPPRRQLAAIDDHIDAARAWLEDERWRVEQLAERLPPEDAERELDAFAEDEQRFERWLDRVDALRARIERGD